MAEPRVPAEWEQRLIGAGMDPAEVEKLRELKESLFRAGEAAIEVIDRQREATSLLLEGVPPEEMNERVGLNNYPTERLDEFRDEVRRCLEHLGFALPGSEPGASKPPPPPPRKQREGRRRN
jgi:hypothetical protein